MNQLIGLYELVFSAQRFLGGGFIKLPDKDGRTDRRLYAEDRNPRHFFKYEYIAPESSGYYGGRHSVTDDEVSNLLITTDEVLESIRALVTDRLQSTTENANKILSDVGSYRLKR
jgi:hypothetical protein